MAVGGSSLTNGQKRRVRQLFCLIALEKGGKGFVYYKSKGILYKTRSGDKYWHKRGHYCNYDADEKLQISLPFFQQYGGTLKKALF
jgi:hypothetical protein